MASPDAPTDRAEAVLRAAEAAAEAAGARVGRDPAAPARLLELADRLGTQAAEARRCLDELEAALARAERS